MVLTGEQLTRGREMIAALLEWDPPPSDHAGPYFLWPRFGSQGHPLLGFFGQAGTA